MSHAHTNSNGDLQTISQYKWDMLRCQQIDWSKHCRLSGWVRNQRWRPLTGSGYEITYISACVRVSNEIPTTIFSVKQHNWTDQNTAVSRGWVSNKRWQSVTGSGYGISYISVCIHDSNDISRILFRIFFHVRVCGKFVEYIHFRLQAAIFDIPLTLT